MHSVAAPKALAAQTPAAVQAAACRALEAEAADLAVEAAEGVVGAGNTSLGRWMETVMKMKPESAKRKFIAAGLCVTGCMVWLLAIGSAQQTASTSPDTQVKAVPAGVRTFSSSQQAADALVKAAEDYDEAALSDIFGPEGRDIIFTGELVQDRQHALKFANAAREKMNLTTDPKMPNRATVVVGNEDWPFPVPIVKSGQKWYFDSKIGRQELLYRRIGANELDAIQICHGYVEAQEEYALKPRQGYSVNQYAQRIISTPDNQDGLAWQNPDGTWGGPIGEKIAKAIEQGYSPEVEPYHGYLFKILKGQGSAAPLGKIDYVVKGVMIGGFALVAAPAEYGVTGVQTFIVSQDGVVYQQDLGTKTLDAFRTMDLFNPDDSWSPVTEQDENEAAE
jgi:hypothetical protein